MRPGPDGPDPGFPGRAEKSQPSSARAGPLWLRWTHVFADEAHPAALVQSRFMRKDARKHRATDPPQAKKQVRDQRDPKKQSPAALLNNTIVAKQFLKEAPAPGALLCNRSSPLAGRVAPTRWSNVGCLFRSPTTSTMPKYPGTDHTKMIGRGRTGGRGCASVKRALGAQVTGTPHPEDA